MIAFLKCWEINSLNYDVNRSNLMKFVALDYNAFLRGRDLKTCIVV